MSPGEGTSRAFPGQGPQKVRSVRPVSRASEALAHLLRSRTAGAAALFLLVFAALLFFLLGGELGGNGKLEAGHPAPRDIKANRNVEVVNQELTDAARQQVAEQVEPVYRFNPLISAQSEEKVNDTFTTLKTMAGLRANRPEEYPGRREALTEELPFPLSAETVDLLTQASPPDLDFLETNTRHILYLVMDKGVRSAPEELEKARQKVAEEARARLEGEYAEYAAAVAEIASKAILPNRVFDAEATRRERQRRVAEVPPVKRLILKDQIVVREGDLLTEEHLKVLEALGLQTSSPTAGRLLGYGLLVLAMMGIVTVYLRQQQPAIYSSNRLLLLLSIVVVAAAGASRYLTVYSGYLAPVVTAAMLIAILLEVRLALLVTALLALFVGVRTLDFPAASVALLTGLIGVLAVTRVARRWDLITASLIVVAGNILAVLAFSLIAWDDLHTTAHHVLVYGAGNGLISALVAVGALPFLENFFGVTTPIKLLELSNQSEPLLQRLIKEAPGTYQHSVMVANLAESAAQAVGADALLCRVGAYYHDVGKLKGPGFFVENQLGTANPHDRLTPSLSTAIIVAHVADGLELAREYGLPEGITRFIAEHHGTSLVSYFYHQACARSADPIFEEDFRYPGPKPQSRETAILMLCDGIEAASRTLAAPTPESLSELVHKIIRQALEDGQLDECDLSLKDLNNIRESTLRTLCGFYHSRIEYPDPGTAPLRARKGRKVTPLRKA